MAKSYFLVLTEKKTFKYLNSSLNGFLGSTIILLTFLYSLKTSPGKNSLDKHIEELQSIIDYSNKKGIRVPPGVHAELGYRLAQTNRNSDAKAELNKEIITYPESRPFIERVTIFLGLEGIYE